MSSSSQVRDLHGSKGQEISVMQVWPMVGFKGGNPKTAGFGRQRALMSLAAW
jgi:hypothetical protein